MAFDGITIANVVKELNDTLIGGRLYKIAQPESDELLITIKTTTGQKRLFLSADASLPLIYLTDTNKISPMTAPNFCMLLRKYTQNGRIINIYQPGLERIITIEIEHLDEMGDLCTKKLIIEIMGKHSNIIFCTYDDVIIDSIKHVSGLISSVREVLPGKPYFIANTQDKENALTASKESFIKIISAKPMSTFKAIYSSYTGFSPIIAHEICHRSNIDGDLPTAALDAHSFDSLYHVFQQLINDIKEGIFTPNIAYTDSQPMDFAAISLTMYSQGADTIKPFDSISQLLESYYAEKNTLTRIRQKSSDLRRIVQTSLERNIKKYDLQLRQMKDTEKKDTFRIYGELLNTYGYHAEEGSKSLEALNYYTNETVTIPLDPTLSPTDNAKKYFAKYNKMKRTFEALSELTTQVHDEIKHLESISAALDIAVQEEDLVEIKEELIESGYIKRKGNQKKIKITSKPFHYISSDGFHMYVGKNNYQNEELTFKVATGNDWWFHAKGIPGSHVIIKGEGEEDLPNTTFEEAGRLAAFYSKAKKQDKVEIDYIQRKHVKKAKGGKPGFVVYHTNYSLIIDCDISMIQKC